MTAQPPAPPAPKTPRARKSKTQAASAAGTTPGTRKPAKKKTPAKGKTATPSGATPPPVKPRPKRPPRPPRQRRATGTPVPMLTNPATYMQARGVVDQATRLVGVPPLETNATGGLPTPLYDLNARAECVTLSTVIDLAASDPVAAALVKALQLDPAALKDDVARQGTLILGHYLCDEVQNDLGYVQDVVDKSRALARGAVDGEVARRLAPDSELTPQERGALSRDFVEISREGQALTAEQQAQRQFRDRVMAQTQAKLSSLSARGELVSVLTALGNGQQPDWSTLVRASQTLDSLLAENAAPSIDDRRGSQRGG